MGLRSGSRAGGRRLGFAVAALAGLIGIVAAGTASAQPITGRGPWCVVMSQFGGTLDCAYYSFEQCQATASGVSNACTRNPWYRGPDRPRRDPRRY